MSHLYTKLFLSLVIATAVIAGTYDMPALEEFDNDPVLVTQAPPIQPGLTLPAAPSHIMPAALEQPAIQMAPQNISPVLPEAPHVVQPAVDILPTPTPPAPIVHQEPAASAPVTPPATHPDTPITAQPLEQKEKVTFPVPAPQPPASVTVEPQVEVKHVATPDKEASDERIKLLIEQLAQLEQKVTALDARLKMTEQKSHKTDSQLTSLINELEAPAPQEDEEPIIGTAPSMEPAHEKKPSDIALFEDDDEEDLGEINHKL
jgi:hypothetical protein